MKLPLQGLEAFVTRAGRPQTRDRCEAKARGDYFLSERQAKAILDMRLSQASRASSRRSSRRSTGELSDTRSRGSARGSSANEHVLFDLIVMELEEIRTRSTATSGKHGDPLRTTAEIADEDLIQEEDMVVVSISHAGVREAHADRPTYRAQKRGGKGKIGMEAREEDFITQLFVSSTHSYVFFFSGQAGRST